MCKKKHGNRNMVFMHDTVASHAANKTKHYLLNNNFTNGSLTKWPVPSPDLNAIENL